MDSEMQESARKLQEVKPFTFWGVPSFKACPLTPNNVWGQYPNNLEKIDVLKTNLTILSLLQHPRRWDTVGILMCRRETLLLELPQPLPTQNVYNLVHKKVQGWLHDGWMAMGALERNSKSPFRWRFKLLWHIG